MESCKAMSRGRKATLPVDDRKKAVLFIGGGLLCFAVVWGLVRGFSGKWPWGVPTGVAGPSWSVRQSMKASEAPIPMGSPEETEAPSSPKGTEKWVVYLTGEVNRPGIVEIPPDSRLYQAVEAAGGLTPKADREGVNLAEKLTDGTHAHIPRIGEPVPAGETGPVPSKGERVLPQGTPGVDVNHASAAEIEKLPGIGPKLAQEIINDRNANGPFLKEEDLLRVKGIGPSKLEKMKGMILIRP